MSWIKPNFLWMMHRSGWRTKTGQEVTLAIRLRREFFDDLLAKTVESFFPERKYSSFEEWQKVVRSSSVRFQWDPDLSPSCVTLERRAIPLGMRGKTLQVYGKRDFLEILDISEFVAEQRGNTSK
jgi:hypothetical protein